MFQVIINEFVSTFTTVLISVIFSNADRLVRYYKRRFNWFRPEFDIKHNESFDIVTSSRNKRKPKDASEEYIRQDKTVIGDIEPVLIALQGRKINTRPFLPDNFPTRRIDENIISFGGEVGNAITSSLLEGLKCPLRFNEYKIIDHRDQIEYLPKWDQEGRIRTDYALIVRAPNPWESNRIVYVFAGIHKPGTLGAACLTQSKFAGKVNKAIGNMKAFVVLAEIQVDYVGTNRKEVIVSPKSIVRVYDLPHEYLTSEY